MKKAYLICTYDNKNRIYGLSAITAQDGHKVDLMWYNPYSGPKPYEHKSFQDMYETCLRIAKNNKFKVNYYEEFNSRWYDIMFINIEEYSGVERFGLNKNI